jgi:hypothetical protein
MLEHCLSIGITTWLIKNAHFPIPDLDHDLLPHIIEDAIGYLELELGNKPLHFARQLCYMVYIDSSKPWIRSYFVHFEIFAMWWNIGLQLLYVYATIYMCVVPMIHAMFVWDMGMYKFKVDNRWMY